jgi:hypothetical protein
VSLRGTVALDHEHGVEPVTAADLASDALLRERLLTAYPDHPLACRSHHATLFVPEPDVPMRRARRTPGGVPAEIGSRGGVTTRAAPTPSVGERARPLDARFSHQAVPIRRDHPTPRGQGLIARPAAVRKEPGSMTNNPRSVWLAIIMIVALVVAVIGSIILRDAGAGPLVLLPTAGGTFGTVVLLGIACWKFLHGEE